MALPSPDPAVPFVLRRATVRDVRAIRQLVEPYVEVRAIVPKPAVAYYEAVQEFRVVELAGRLVGCGAVHAMWEDVAEVRTVAVDPAASGRGIGSALMTQLLQDARALGVDRVFCLTFEVEFFARFGFAEIDGHLVPPEVYGELLQSYDEGVAEFLDLDRIKPNTLGNTRMLLNLDDVREDEGRETVRTEGSLAAGSTVPPGPVPRRGSSRA